MKASLLVAIAAFVKSKKKKERDKYITVTYNAVLLFDNKSQQAVCLAYGKVRSELIDNTSKEWKHKFFESGGILVAYVAIYWLIKLVLKRYSKKTLYAHVVLTAV